MTEHLVAKLVTALAGMGVVVAAAAPEEFFPFSAEHVEAWARFGVAGGCLLIMAIGLLYLIPKIIREHRQQVNEAHATYERTIDRICTSHAASMQEIRESHREDGRDMGKALDRMATSIEGMKDAIHEESEIQVKILQQQLTAIRDNKT